MKNDFKEFQDRPFDCKKIEQLDKEAIDTGIEEGSKWLSYQYTSIKSVESNLKMILGWLVGAMMALIGTLVITGTSGTLRMSVIITAAYELISAFCLAIYITFKGLYKYTIFFPGDTPSHLFRDKVLLTLSKFDNVKTKYIKGWYLDELQFRILENNKVQSKKVSVYRLSLLLCLCALLSGGLLLIILMSVGL